MTKHLSLLGLTVLSSFIAVSQNSTPKSCSVNAEDGQIIKQRMLDNRANVNLDEARSRSAAITYIPTTIHIIGDDDGNGYTELPLIFKQICDVNTIYYDQDVQFYIQFPFNYINSTAHHEDIDASHNYLTQQKVANTMNVFVGRSINNASSSFYTPSGDWLFLLRTMATSGPTTLAHEMGHFYTLPHTFVGWEGQDARDYTGGPTPNSIGWGGQVEKETRGAGSNCYSAADGFCDTPADYYSFRAACPMNDDIRDPQNNPIDPDEENMMSYYYDACVNKFSSEQKDAMFADISARGWLNFPAPASLVNLENDTAEAVFPIGGDTIGVPTINDMTLNWEPVTGAEGYLLVFAKTHEVAPVNIQLITEELLMGENNTTYTIDSSVLEDGEYYRWRVTPINSYKPCADYGLGNYNRFFLSGTSNAEAGDVNGNGTFDEGEIAGDTNGNGEIDGNEIMGDTNGNGTIDGTEVEGDGNGDGVNGLIEDIFGGVKLFPNPAENILTVELGENNNVETVSILDVTGKLVESNSVQTSMVTVNVAKLKTGVYFIQLSNSSNKEYHRFVKL